MKQSTLRIAWRNLSRNRKRTAIAITAIALGQFTLVFVNCMMAGMYSDMLDTITGPLVGHVQVRHPEWREERALDLYVDRLDEVKAVIGNLPDVKSVSPRIYAPALSVSGEKRDEPADAEPAMIVGVDVAVESGKGGLLEKLSPDERPAGDEVVLGKVLARRLGLSAGQRIAIIGQDADEFPTSGRFRVRAVMRSPTEVVNTLGVVMSLQKAQEFLSLPDQAHEIIVQGEDHRRADELSAAVKGVPGLEAAEVMTWKEAVPLLVTMIGMKDWIDLIFVAILFIAAAAGIVNTMMMSTFERTHEFGMLLSLGARPRRIVLMILLESLILGLVAVAIGSILGAGIVLLTGHTGIDYGALSGIKDQEFAFQGISISYVLYPIFEWRHVFFGIGAVTLTAILASVWPAAIVTRLEPAEAIRS